MATDAVHFRIWADKGKGIEERFGCGCQAVLVCAELCLSSVCPICLSACLSVSLSFSLSPPLSPCLSLHVYVRLRVCVNM